ncbi:phage late control D family protein [Vibrio sp. OPT18]|uniref:phage late control D family protein n=1 Tax=Vibrio sp. OPT18 TaxID=2778641 RepID=UPI00187FC4D0|nr:hypothetical protein [Vibrio sp. OPT18]MBE8578633.1 hypothetical protein [Vibrio sp. OPT18]
MGKIITSVIKPFAIVKWAGKEISAELAPFVGSLTYTDVLDSDKVGTDTVSLTLNNNDGRFFDSWYPDEGDTLECGIGWYDDKGNRGSWLWGMFSIDSVTFAVNPNKVTVSANAKPATRGKIDNKESKTFEKTSFLTLAQDIAKQVGVEVLISPTARDVEYARVQQRDENTLGMLGRLAHENSIPVAIKGNQLVVGEINHSELVLDIQRRDVLLNATLPVSNRTKYDGITVHYFNELEQVFGSFSVGNVQSGAKVKELYPEIHTLEEAKAYAQNYMATGSGNNTKQMARGRMSLVNTTVTTADVIKLINAGKLPDKWKPTTVSTSLTGSGWQSTVNVQRQS